MGRYKVQLRGENFLLDLDGEHSRFGFTATRVVNAASGEEARKIATIILYQELNQSSHVVKNIYDAPRIKPERVDELNFYHFVRKKTQSGFNFVKDEILPS